MVAFCASFLSRDETSGNFTLFAIHFSGSDTIIEAGRVSGTNVAAFRISSSGHLKIGAVSNCFVLHLPGADTSRSLTLLGVVVLSSVGLVHVRAPTPRVRRRRIIASDVVPGSALHTTESAVTRIIAATSVLIGGTTAGARGGAGERGSRAAIAAVRPAAGAGHGP